MVVTRIPDSGTVDPGVAGPTQKGPVAALGRLLPEDLGRDLSAIRDFVLLVRRRPTSLATDAQMRLHQIRADLVRLYAGQAAELPQVEALRFLVAAGLPADVPNLLVTGALAEATAPTRSTFDDVAERCAQVADPIGSMVLWSVGRATPDRIALSGRICTGLRLLGCCRMVGVDARAGRVHLPTDDLHRFDVAVADLRRPSAGPAVRALLAFESTRALAWVDAGAPIVSTLRGWARLLAGLAIAQGRASARSLADANYDPLTATPAPSAGELASWWLRACVRRAG